MLRPYACLRTALALRPDLAEAHYDLANALVHLDQIELAIAHYHRALEIQPDYAEAHGKLANVLSDLGRWQEALIHYQSAGDRLPTGRSHRQAGVAAGDVSPR